jgi:hypothetical protein
MSDPPLPQPSTDEDLTGRLLGWNSTANKDGEEIGLKKGLVSDDKDLMVVTAGFPFGTPGAANIIRVIPAAGPTFWDETL